MKGNKSLVNEAIPALSFFVFLLKLDGIMPQVSPLQEIHNNHPFSGYTLSYFSFKESYEHSHKESSGSMLNPGGFSFFTQHNLKATTSEPELKAIKSTDWITVMILFVILLLTFMRFQSGRKLTYLFRAIFSTNDATIMHREGNIFKDQMFIPLFLIFTISQSLFFFEVYSMFTTIESDLHSIALIYGIITFALLAYFLLKVLMVYLSGWIFETKEVTSEYIHNLFLFNFFIGIILTPILMLIVFSSQNIFVYTGLGLMVLALFYRFIRGFSIGLSNTKYSVLHLFLYLCTLEILPLVIIGKIVLRYVFT